LDETRAPREGGGSKLPPPSELERSSSGGPKSPTLSSEPVGDSDDVHLSVRDAVRGGVGVVCVLTLPQNMSTEILRSELGRGDSFEGMHEDSPAVSELWEILSFSHR
jgi:hypothetical protein